MMNIKTNGVALLKTLVIAVIFYGLTACDQTPSVNSETIENSESELLQKETLLLHFVDHTVVGQNNGQYRLNYSDLSSLSSMELDRTNGLEYIGIPINNITLNPIFRCKIAAENSLLNNEIERKEILQSFQDSLTKTLAQIYPTNDSCYKSTSFYLPFARTINNYRNDPRKKIVIIQSDLLENTTQLSLITDEYLFRHSHKLRQKFEQIHDLPNMRDFEIILLFQPKAENNQLFESAVDFFTEWFEESGATVKVQASL